MINGSSLVPDFFLSSQVSARRGELGIIPGSMGARSFIVRGKGNPESFHRYVYVEIRVEIRERSNVLLNILAKSPKSCRSFSANRKSHEHSESCDVSTSPHLRVLST